MILGNTLKDTSEKSAHFQSFEHYMFIMEDNLSKSLFSMVNPGVIEVLTEDEKILAEGILIRSLQKKFDRRWIWALGEIGTPTVYEFLMDQFQKEEVPYTKVNYAYTLVMVNKTAPVLEYLQGVLQSEEDVEVKKRALNALYWLYNKPFEDKDRQQLYISILFDAMTDSLQDIRVNAYGILKDHYGMREFTPADDPVLNILSSSGKREEYQEAVRMFEDRIRSVEVTPLSREKIIQWIKNLPNNEAKIRISDCKVCSTIPEKSEADMTRNESLNEYKSKLETAVRFAYYSNEVKRCPICGRFFIYKYEYEYLVTNSEEDEYLWRTDIDGAMKLVDSFLKFYDFKNVITCGQFLKVSY